MNANEHRYLDLLRRLRDRGTFKDDRTGTGTLSLFGEQIRLDLEHFPLLTTKRVRWKSVMHELLWFLRGDTDLSYLHEHGVHFWDPWADDRGHVGPLYGAAWRHLFGVDQVKNLVRGLNDDPDSRRHVVTTWHPAHLGEMALPPCHVMFQCYVLDSELSMHVYMRSCDAFIGLPFNIASYALLSRMLCHVCQLHPGELVFSFGDLHLYANHVDEADTQLQRTPYAPPQVILDDGVARLDDFTWQDIQLVNYLHHPEIVAPVAV